MPGSIITIPRLRFIDANGIPLAGGTVDVYLAGTTTPTPTWQNKTMTILNTNPVILDGAGSCVIWLNSALQYKIVVKDKNGVLLWTQDNIVGGGVDDSYELTPALIDALVAQAEYYAGSAHSAASYLSTYMDQVIMNITFPLDLGLITDPVIYNTFDLGTI